MICRSCSLSLFSPVSSSVRRVATRAELSLSSTRRPASTPRPPSLHNRVIANSTALRAGEINRDGKEIAPGSEVARSKPKQSNSKSDPRNLLKSEEVPEQADKRELWMVYKDALREKYKGQAWNPRKRISPTAIIGIQDMNRQFPTKFTTAVLAQEFKVSPDVIRRILKSKWRPSDEEQDDRNARWERRGVRIWSVKAAQGVKPPKRWRDLGIVNRWHLATGPHDRGKDKRAVNEDVKTADSEAFYGHAGRKNAGKAGGGFVADAIL